MIYHAPVFAGHIPPPDDWPDGEAWTGLRIRGPGQVVDGEVVYLSPIAGTTVSYDGDVAIVEAETALSSVPSGWVAQ